MPTQIARTSSSPAHRTGRRLKPEVAARVAARRRQTELSALYQTPVEKLSPDEIARMKAAFLRG